MAQGIYGLMSDSGDGTFSQRWFRNRDLVELLLSDDCSDPDIWSVNDGYPTLLVFPDDLDLEQCGFTFDDDNFASELADVLAKEATRKG